MSMLTSMAEAQARLWPNGFPSDGGPETGPSNIGSPPINPSAEGDSPAPSPPTKTGGLKTPSISGLVLVAVFRVSDLVEAIWPKSRKP